MKLKKLQMNDTEFLRMKCDCRRMCVIVEGC